MEKIEKTETKEENLNEKIKEEIFKLNPDIKDNNINIFFYNEIGRSYKGSLEDNKKLFSTVFIEKNNFTISQYMETIGLNPTFETRKRLFKEYCSGENNYKGSLDQNLQLFHELVYKFELEKRLEENEKKKKTQTELETQKGEIEKEIQSEYNKEFAEFISEISLNKIDRDSFEGRFLRTFRYMEEIKHTAQKREIPTKMLFVLAMVESCGDPISINGTADGGAGLIHMQPGIAKKYGLTLYSERLKEYQNYDSNSPGYAPQHGKGLEKLCEKYNRNYEKLSKIDDRFNVSKCLKAAAKHLQHLRNHRYVKNSEKYTSDSSRDIFQKNEQFKRLLTLNGYNKGLGSENGIPNIYKKFFDTHMKNIRASLKQYEKNMEILNQNAIKRKTKKATLEEITGAEIQIEENGNISSLKKKFIKVGKGESLTQLLKELNRNYNKLHGKTPFITNQELISVAEKISENLNYIYPGEKFRMKRQGEKLVIEKKNEKTQKSYLFQI